MGRGLGKAFAAVAAGLPGSDDAAFLPGAAVSLSVPTSDPQDRRPVEAAALPVVRASIARGTIERRPENSGATKPSSAVRVGSGVQVAASTAEAFRD